MPPIVSDFKGELIKHLTCHKRFGLWLLVCTGGQVPAPTETQAELGQMLSLGLPPGRDMVTELFVC